MSGPRFTEDAFDELIARGRIDWRYVDGELCVLGNFLDSLRVYPAEVPGLTPEPPYDTAARDAVLAEMREHGAAACEITLRASLEVPGGASGRDVARLAALAGCLRAAGRHRDHRGDAWRARRAGDGAGPYGLLGIRYAPRV